MDINRLKLLFCCAGQMSAHATNSGASHRWG
jgi:hypothetical protein